jgi:hypothetical protein
MLLLKKPGRLLLHHFPANKAFSDAVAGGGTTASELKVPPFQKKQQHFLKSFFSLYMNPSLNFENNERASADLQKKTRRRTNLIPSGFGSDSVLV